MKITLNLTDTEAACLRACLYDRASDALYSNVDNSYTPVGRVYDKLNRMRAQGRFKFLSVFPAHENYYGKENV